MIQREPHTCWHNMKFDYVKHDVEEFAYDLKFLSKVIGLSDEQVLEYFKEFFHPKIESYSSLRKISVIDMEIFTHLKAYLRKRNFTLYILRHHIRDGHMKP